MLYESDTQIFVIIDREKELFAPRHFGAILIPIRDMDYELLVKKYLGYLNGPKEFKVRFEG